MIVFLILAALLAGETRAVERTLNTSACNKGWSCAVLSRCVNTESDDILEETRTTDTINDNCPLIIQTRNLVSKIVYLIEVIRSDLVSPEHQQLQLLGRVSENEILVGCKSNGNKVELLIGNATKISMYKIALFEDLSFFKDGHILCAFTIEKAKKMAEDLGKNWKKASDTLGIRYLTTGLPGEHRTQVVRERKLLTEASSRCDSYAFQESSSLEGFKIQSVKNRHTDELNCINYNLPYKLHVKHSSIEDKVISKLTCDDEDEWRIVSVDGVALDPIQDIEEYSFWCAAKISHACTKPNLICKPPNCPKFTAGTDETDAFLTCPEGKWKMDWLTPQGKTETEYNTNLTMVCKEHDVLQNEAAFFYTIDGAEQRLPETAQCFSKYNCSESSLLDYSECAANSEGCHDLDYSNGKIMKCGKAPRTDGKPVTLTLKPLGSNMTSPFNSSFYTCDERDGQWKDDMGRAIPLDYSVSCDVEVSRESEKRKFTDLEIALIGSAFAIALVIVLLVLGRVYYRHKIKAATAKVVSIDRTQWHKMNTAERVKFIRNTKMCVLASDLEEKKIFTAMGVIDTLLETETEEPEVWEECYTFIYMLQGALREKEHGILLMLNRYLFRKSKAIIAKHGWISPHRITKSNPRGLIRVVAIKLLLKSMNCLKNENPEEFLLDGLTQLSKKEDAVEQYPHCGVLWQAITQVHFERRKTNLETLNDVRTVRGYKVCVENLHKYAFVDGCAPIMESSDVIDAFGTPAEQAAEALGSTESTEYHTAHIQHIFRQKPQLIQRYLRGKAFSISADPSKNLFHGGVNLNVDLLKRVKKSANDSSLDDITDLLLRTLVSSERIVDAKKMEDIFRPDPKRKPEDTSDKIAEMMCNHGHIGKAVKAQSKLIRQWFSERIPINDLNYHYTNDTMYYRENEFGPESPSSALKNSKTETGCTTKPADMEKVPLERKKTTMLTPAKLTEYMTLFKKILSRNSVMGRKVHIPPDLVLELTEDMIELMKYEPVLIEDVPAPIVVVGDLHGQLFDLNRIFDTLAEGDKSGYLNSKFLFMGDYVDRGNQSLDVVMCLFILKICYPDNFFILRGNHEVLEINKRYGFEEELKNRYPDGVAQFLHYAINDAFSWLSVAAIIGDEIFCAHGGISINLFTRSQMRAINKPVYSSLSVAILNDIMWSDPAEELIGTVWNGDRGSGVYHGANEIALALLMMNCKIMFRGHQWMLDTYSVACNVCVTIFSAAGQSESDASVAMVDKFLKIKMMILKYDPKRDAYEKPADEPDTPTRCEDIGDGKIVKKRNK